MTYRTRTIISAAAGLAVMAALGLFVYYGLHAEHESEKHEQAFARLALDVDKSRVRRIELDRGAERVTLERSGVSERSLPAWRLTAPLETEADPMVVNAVLSLLDQMDAERRIPLSEAATLKKYGLDPPALTWTLTMDDGERIGLQVGRKSPFDDRLYLHRVGADEIMLVKGHFADSLTKDAFDLRRKELLRVEPDLVQGLILVTPPRPADSGKPRVRIELARRDAGWFMTAPIADRADPVEVRKLLNTMRNLRARAFPSAGIPDARYGLDPPGWEVILLSGPERSRSEVRIGRGQLPSNREKLFARVVEPKGPVVELPAYVLSVLDKTPFALQAKAPVVFDPGQAARIKLSKEAELIVLERSRPEFDAGPVPKGQESWMLVSPVAGEAKSYRVQALLAALTQLKAKRFDGPADPDELMRTGLERPVLTVVVEDDSGKQIARLQIGKAEKEDTFVLGDAREKICLVPTAALASVNVGQADLRAGPAGGGGHEKP